MIGASAALSVGASGCLAAQDDDLLPPLIQLNRAPWIVADTTRVSGKFGDYVELQTGCAISFEAVAEDPDVDDRLQYRWLVTRLEPPDERRVPDEGYLRPNGRTRRDPLTLDFKRDQVVNYLAQPGLYLVQVLVSDGVLLGNQGPGDMPDPDPIPGTDGGFNPRFAAYHTWTVQMELGNDCGPDGELP